MTKQLAAVLGTGQTKYVAKRKDVSMNGLVREAIDRALADSGSTFDDIDAVVVGKAPDFFEGVMMPELFLADAIGATGKPLIRVHTAGSVGGSTAVVAASLVQSGKYTRVLAMAWEKQSESNAMWALSIPVPFTKPVGAGAGGYFAPHVRAYIRRSGAPTHIGAMVAVKDRLNGAKNPLAHLHQPDITLEKVLSSQMLWDPIRFDETCPSSDGACALVIGNEEIADTRVAEGHPVAWIHATSLRTEPLAFSGRDQVNPQAGRDAAKALWKAAGITSPIDEIDAAEIYVPFSWFEPMWLENLGFAPEGEGWKLTEAGETAIGGRIPVNASGGVLSSNPIGASGMIRFAEAAIQVMGRPVTTRSRARARRSATPTAAARSTTRCGSSAQISPGTSRHEIHGKRGDEPGRPTCRARQDGRGSRVRFDRAARFDLLHGEAVRGLPLHPRRLAHVERGHPVGRSADRRGRDGCGDDDAALLHQRDEARVTQPAAAGPTGRLSGEPDQQPVRFRRRDRLGA
jgi:acetyl-CoA C-acetyltransferase